MCKIVSDWNLRPCQARISKEKKEEGGCDEREKEKERAIIESKRLMRCCNFKY